MGNLAFLQMHWGLLVLALAGTVFGHSTASSEDVAIQSPSHWVSLAPLAAVPTLPTMPSTTPHPRTVYVTVTETLWAESPMIFTTTSVHHRLSPMPSKSTSTVLVTRMVTDIVTETAIFERAIGSILVPELVFELEPHRPQPSSEPGTLLWTPTQVPIETPLETTDSTTLDTDNTPSTMITFSSTSSDSDASSTFAYDPNQVPVLTTSPIIPTEFATTTMSPEELLDAFEPYIDLPFADELGELDTPVGPNETTSGASRLLSSVLVSLCGILAMVYLM